MQGSKALKAHTKLRPKLEVMVKQLHVLAVNANSSRQQTAADLIADANAQRATFLGNRFDPDDEEEQNAEDEDDTTDQEEDNEADDNYDAMDDEVYILLAANASSPHTQETQCTMRPIYAHTCSPVLWVG